MQKRPTLDAHAGAARVLRWAVVCLAVLPSQALAQSIRITEFAYKAESGEFIELTNVGSVATSLGGWSIDDEEAMPGAFDLSSAGVIAPGESIVITTVPAADFRTAWSLGSSQVTVLGDNDTAKLSRTDAIVVFDPSGTVVDRIGFSDIDFEYSVRARDISAWVCSSAIGQDDPYGWRLSSVGDGQGSTASSANDVGSPGVHMALACDPLLIGVNYCDSRPNSTGSVARMSAVGHPVVSESSFSIRVADLPANAIGLAIMGRQQTVVLFPAGSQGILCVGPGLTRLNSLVGAASASGVWTADLDLANPTVQNLPIVQQGQTWYFQLWYRDANPGPASNFSTGWTVNFQ